MEEILKNLTNQELKEAYNELVEIKSLISIKKDGMITSIHEKFCKEYRVKREIHFDFVILKELILLEIAKRFVKLI